MRLDVREDSETHWEFEAYLDGMYVKDCVAADTDQGWVDVIDWAHSFMQYKEYKRLRGYVELVDLTTGKVFRGPK